MVVPVPESMTATLAFATTCPSFFVTLNLFQVHSRKWMLKQVQHDG